LLAAEAASKEVKNQLQQYQDELKAFESRYKDVENRLEEKQEGC